MVNPAERVVFFIPTLEVGGAERVVVTIVNNLRHWEPVLVLWVNRGSLAREVRKGVEVYALSSGRSSGEPGGENRFRTWKTRFRMTLSRLLPGRLAGVVIKAHRLAKLAHTGRIPILVSFLTMPNVIAIMAKVLFNRRLKVIVNVHDVTSRILKHSELKTTERFLLYWLVRLFYPRADLIVTVAEGVKHDLVQSFGISAAKIVVVWNPVDIEGIRVRAKEPVEHPWFQDRRGPLIVGVGRLVKLKGFDLLIRAFAQVPEQLGARLVIVGDGKERPALEELVGDLGLSERVALLGFQENPWKYMARADMFVLSSLTEGFPNVLGEALALGVPVLATDCSPGVREYLGDNECGLLVPPGDVGALAEGIKRLLSDLDLRARLAERGRKRVTAFDLPRAVERYEALLTGVLQQT